MDQISEKTAFLIQGAFVLFRVGVAAGWFVGTSHRGPSTRPIRETAVHGSEQELDAETWGYWNV